MKNITIHTTPSITFDQWVTQARRFAKIDDKVQVANLPVDTDTSCHATIEVAINQPLIYGFDGTIKYYQNYTIDQPTYDLDPDTFEPIGEPTIKTLAKRKLIISYNERLDSATISALIESVQDQLPSEMSFIQRLELAIKMIITGNAVQHHTFGLTFNDWK